MKGLGIIATQHISSGDLILAEAPVLVIPHFETRPQEARQAIVTQFSALTGRQRDEVFSLCNAFPATTAIEGIIKTNVLPLKDSAGSSGIFVLSSRFNHSCVANAAFSFHSTSNTLSIRAVKTMKSGEEITISYLPQPLWTQSSSSRRSYLLQNFNFLCHCPTCSQPSHLLAPSDLRRDSIASLTRAISSTQLLVSQPGRALLYCRHILRLLNEEGEKGILLSDSLLTASQVCAAHSDYQRAKGFLGLALEAWVACHGKDGSARSTELEMLIDHPERHYLAGISHRWCTGAHGSPTAGSIAFEAWLWERAGDESTSEKNVTQENIGVMVRCSRGPRSTYLSLPLKDFYKYLYAFISQDGAGSVQPF